MVTSLLLLPQSAPGNRPSVEKGLHFPEGLGPSAAKYKRVGGIGRAPLASVVGRTPVLHVSSGSSDYISQRAPDMSRSPSGATWNLGVAPERAPGNLGVEKPLASRGRAPGVGGRRGFPTRSERFLGTR